MRRSTRKRRTGRNLPDLPKPAGQPESQAPLPPPPVMRVDRERPSVKGGRVGGGSIPAVYDEEGKLIAYGRHTE